MSLQEVAKRHGVQAIAKAIVADQDAHEISQQEFLKLGREVHGAEFPKMLADVNSDVFKAVAVLHDADVAKWNERWIGSVPQSEVNAAEEIAKMRESGWSRGGVGTVSTRPVGARGAAVDAVVVDAVDEMRAMIAAEMRTAPWLTPAQAEARVREATRAAERAAERKRQARRA